MNSPFRILQNNQLVINSSNQSNKSNQSNQSNQSNSLVINSSNQSNSIVFNPFVINSNTNKAIRDSNLIKSNQINKTIKDIKYWEYGNSGLKIKNFNKIMGKNLSILYYINKTFEQLFSNEKITIKKLFNKKFSNIFSIGSSKINCSNTNVSVELDHNKISGIYKLVAGGISTISNIKILPEELTKLKVPELSNVLNNLDNTKLIIKLTNILNLFNNFDIKNDISDPAFNLYNIIINSLSIISNYKNDDKEKKLLKSNSNNAFYIKIYDSYCKAFIIDDKQKLIYYISTKELDDKIIFKYYVFNINDKWKII
jgi:hypothetical protein